MTLAAVPASARWCRAAAAAALLGALPPGHARGADGATRARLVMGTTCSIEVARLPEAEAAAAAVAALDTMARWESVLSTWDPAAEMARANAVAQHGTSSVSPELAEALGWALAQARRTQGAFDPAVGALVDAWDLRGAGRVPDAAAREAALGATGHRLVRLDVAARTLAFDAPGAWLDTGAFGKGLALDAAATVLRARGAPHALLDFGGQLLALGAPAEGERWTIGVADPRERARPVLRLRLDEASASTSGQSERFVEADGRRLGHVLDPRTGSPVAFDGSVTVVAPSAAEADALSTALLVMGPDAGLEFARRHDVCAGWLVDDEGLELRATRSFLSRVDLLDSRVRVAGRTVLTSFARPSR